MKEPTQKKTNNIIVFCLSVFLIVLFAVFLFVFSNRTKSVNNNQAEVTQTVFKSYLEQVISEKSLYDGKQYILDEKYYNEYIAKTYISTMNDVIPENISPDHIKTSFDRLFLKVLIENNSFSLIQKDYLTLLEETENKIKMNEMDYKIYGTTNDDIVRESKGFYISQNDPVFSEMKYGSGNINTSGCGPICVAMAVNYVTNTNTTTLENVVNWANENNMYEMNSGTRWSLIRNYPRTVSVNCDEIYMNSVEELSGILSENQVLITSMGAGSFTDKGHFIVITDISDGLVSVLDPASIFRSLKKWDINLIYNESNKYFWKIYI